MKKYLIFATVLLAALFFASCNTPGDTPASTTVCEHKWGKFEALISATCTEDGSGQRRCELCGITNREVITALGHSEITDAAVPPSCTEEGMSEGSHCEICGTIIKEQTVITPFGHDLDDGKVVLEPSCEINGLKTKTCKICGKAVTESIEMLGHSLNSDKICTICGAKCPIDLAMTPGEKLTALTVDTMTSWSVRHEDTSDGEGYQLLFFALKDKDEKELAVPAIAEITITNSKGVVVYSQIRAVKTSDFSTWTSQKWGDQLLASIMIPDSEILPGKSSVGKIRFEVYNGSFFTFDFVEIDTYDLPTKSTLLKTPSLPLTVNSYSYDGSVASKFSISDISYKISGDDMIIVLSGKKLGEYDEDFGPYARFKYKLYDSEGYVIEQGTYYFPDLETGDKFKDEEIRLYDCVVAGEEYTLKISEDK